MRFQQPLVDFGLRWAGAHARAAARCIPGPDEYTVHTGKDFERKEHVWKLIIRDEGNYLVTILFKPDEPSGGPCHTLSLIGHSLSRSVCIILVMNEGGAKNKKQEVWQLIVQSSFVVFLARL
jgi:hypothetical protein